MAYERQINPNHLLEHEGRIGRARYAATTLIAQLVGAICVMMINEVTRFPNSGWIAIPTIVVVVISFFASIKRLHDINLSGWYSLIGLIPVLGTILYLVLCFKRGTAGTNHYGTRRESAREKAVTATTDAYKTVAQKVKSPSASDDIEQRLKKLQELHQKGLIDEETFKDGQRQAIERYSTR